MKQMPVQRHNLGFLGEAGSWGTSSTQDEKTQDNQHKLIQPKRSFAEIFEV